MQNLNWASQRIVYWAPPRCASAACLAVVPVIQQSTVHVPNLALGEQAHYRQLRWTGMPDWRDIINGNAPQLARSRDEKHHCQRFLRRHCSTADPKGRPQMSYAVSHCFMRLQRNEWWSQPVQRVRDVHACRSSPAWLRTPFSQRRSQQRLRVHGMSRSDRLFAPYVLVEKELSVVHFWPYSGR